MEEEEAEQSVRQLVIELREARETREDADRRIAGLRKLVEGYLELFPLLDSLITSGDLEDEDDEFGKPIRPRGMDAALTVLKDFANKWYPVSAVVALLDQRGWMPRSSNPRNAVRAALERLVETGAIQKGKATGDGTVIYRFLNQTPAPEDEFGEEPF